MQGHHETRVIVQGFHNMNNQNSKDFSFAQIDQPGWQCKLICSLAGTRISHEIDLLAKRQCIDYHSSIHTVYTHCTYHSLYQFDDGYPVTLT